MNFEGISGLEAEITYNGLILNRRRALAGQGFRYKVTDIGGLDDADVRDAREVNPGRDGELALPAYYGGRTITITGKIIAPNLRELRVMQQDLRTAFSTLTEQQLSFNVGATNNVYIAARKSAPIQMREIQNDQQPTREFMVTLRASDPRFYSSLTETVGASNFTSGKSFNVVNGGNASVDPIIRINGPLAPWTSGRTTFTITNSTSGESFTLPVDAALMAASSFNVEINSLTNSISGSYNYGKFQAGSQFPNLKAGTNTIVTAGLTGTGRVAVIFKKAWL